VDEVRGVEEEVLLDEDVRSGRDDRLESVQSLEPIPTNGHGTAAIRYDAGAPEIRECAVDNDEVRRGIAGCRDELDARHSLVGTARIDRGPDGGVRLVRPRSTEGLKSERGAGDVGDGPGVPVRVVLIVRQTRATHPDEAADLETSRRPVDRRIADRAVRGVDHHRILRSEYAWTDHAIADDEVVRVVLDADVRPERILGAAQFEREERDSGRIVDSEALETREAGAGVRDVAPGQGDVLLEPTRADRDGVPGGRRRRGLAHRQPRSARASVRGVVAIRPDIVRRSTQPECGQYDQCQDTEHQGRSSSMSATRALAKARTALLNCAAVSCPVESRMSFKSEMAFWIAVSRSRFGWVEAASCAA